MKNIGEKLAYVAAGGAVYLVGNFAADPYYESRYIEPAQKEVFCTDDLTEISVVSVPLPGDCSESKLAELYGQEPHNNATWSVIDGILQRERVELTDFTYVSEIQANAEANLQRQKENKDDFKQNAGLAVAGIYEASLVAASVARWRKNRDNETSGSVKQRKPGRLKRAIGFLGLSTVAADHEPQEQAVSEKEYETSI